MRKISTKNVQEGMMLSKPIYSSDGHVLLGEGILLKQSYIKRLESYNISEIYIQDDISEDIEINDVIKETTRVEAKVLVKKTMDDYKENKRFISDGSKIMVNRIIDELLANRHLVVNLSDIKSTDDYTFSHSVNVCVLSLITGIKLGLDQLKLRDLGVGAILHDIGKMMISEEILKKPSILTDEEFEQIKEHTVLGYNIVKTDPNVKATSAYIVLSHHERYDGSGYPRKISGEDIHLFARIVAIADVFDALASDRVYRKKLKTYEVVKYLNASSVTHFDKDILQCFIKSIPIYAIGTSVLLSTGEKGIVVDTNKEFPTRPIVRIVYLADGSRNNKFEEIDLTKKLNIIIIDTCDI